MSCTSLWENVTIYSIKFSFLEIKIIPECMLYIAIYTKINGRIHGEERQIDEVEHMLYR